MTDLLTLRDHEPPMGDLGTRGTLAFNRAVWTAPLDDEDGAPEHRIIHARALQLHVPTHLHRLGVRRAPAYHKCGSRQDLDWVEAFRALAWNGDGWQTLHYERDLGRPSGEAPRWFDLDNVETSAVILEVRRCGIDGWWTPWNLAAGAFVLEGEIPPLAPCDERALDVDATAGDVRDGVARFRTPFLDAGFYLNRAGMAHLGLDAAGTGATGRDLLFTQPGIFYQGLQLHPVGGTAEAAPALRYRAEGTTRVEERRVTYDVHLPGASQHYRLTWEVLGDRLRLHAKRDGDGDEPLRAWNSSAWMMGLRQSVAPPHLLAALLHTGQTGQTELPAWLDLPGFGSLRITTDTDAATLRSDVNRPLDLSTIELKLGEEPQPEGDYLLQPGRYRATIEMRLDRPDVPITGDAPEAVRQAVRRCGLTALSYRPDTGTLSNNGASIHCPISMDTWAATATRLGPILPDIDAALFLRDSLERWLDGGPGYASGPLLHDGTPYAAEDEYLMTGTACLLGLARFLEHAGTAEWVTRYRLPILRQLDAMRARDLDDDGLVESPYRTGISGTGQWSTCWFDVISFGWKDAFANALLYPALTSLARTLPVLEHAELADGLAGWAERLRDSYAPTFFNQETGWLAGWRCKEGHLHDYAFLPVNGAAVWADLLDDETARDVIGRMWEETRRVDLPDAALGLPGNLWPIPDEDLAGIMQGFPYGYYQNGGRTHAQSRHFVRALYHVGMDAEADHLLERLCTGLAEGRVYGGSKSGVDWRFWDGRPCGYEGLLTDQFGVVGMALERYGTLHVRG